ncbi:hypothetical protein BAE44_0007893, partial [Dichanthelium oligosanthes]
MGGANSSTIRSTYYHPQHMLSAYDYSDASTYTCTACERVATGAGYRCGKCDFNIHKACLTGLPGSISIDQLREHRLTLTRLDTSQSCGICQETSHVGRYMYLYASGIYVHPRCVLIASAYFHPQHCLAFYDYAGTLTSYPCTACEGVIIGVRYHYGEYDFNIHKVCLSLPESISFVEHNQHELTLTHLGLGASQCCNVCKKTSHAGAYKYLCTPCNYGGHPRCMLITSAYFHPQHCLAFYDYDGASTNYPCATCEHVITGIGYRCDECDFNIHESCLGLPESVSFAEHSQHELTVTSIGASRWCDLCKEMSHAGNYMYLCTLCNYNVHPKCTTLVAHLVTPLVLLCGF